MDGISSLTRGQPLSFQRLVSTLNPAYQTFTAILDDDVETPARCAGQIRLKNGLTAAFLSFIHLPESWDVLHLTTLLEYLAVAAGNWGAFNLTAELPVAENQLFTALREADFSVMAKQHYWQVENIAGLGAIHDAGWRIWTQADVQGMRSLYYTVVPSLIQSVEPLSRRSSLGLVCEDDSGQVAAYADIVGGSAGIWVLPIIRPDFCTHENRIKALLAALPNVNGRKVYLCARSYQPWLEAVLQRMDLSMSDEMVLMVKHLARTQKVNFDSLLTRLEKQAEKALPAAHYEHKDINRL